MLWSNVILGESYDVAFELPIYYSIWAYWYCIYIYEYTEDFLMFQRDFYMVCKLMVTRFNSAINRGHYTVSTISPSLTNFFLLIFLPEKSFRFIWHILTIFIDPVLDLWLTSFLVFNHNLLRDGDLKGFFTCLCKYSKIIKK